MADLIGHLLLIQEAADGHLRGLLEGLVHELDLGDLAVAGKLAVGAQADVLRNLGLGLGVQQGGGDGLLVREDEGDQLAAAVHDHGLQHERLVVHDRLEFLRIDVLAGRTQDHVLGTAADEDVAFGVDDAEVTGAEPAVIRERVGRGLLVLVVADHDVLAAGLDLADHILRVFGIDPDFRHVHRLAAGPGHIFGPVLIRQQRAGLGHAIAHQVREFDLLEDAFDLGIQRSAAHDEFLDIAAECLLQPFADLLVDDAPDTGNLEGEFNDRLVENGLELGFVDLLHHERYGDEEVGLHVRESLHQGRRSRSLAQPVDRSPVAERIDEFDHEAVHVGHRKHGDHLVAGRYIALAVVDVGREIPVREHDALRVARGAGSVVDGGEIVPVIGRIDDVVGTEAVGVFLGEVFIQMIVGRLDLVVFAEQELPGIDGEDGADIGHLGDVHLLESVAVGKQGDAVAVVHKPHYALDGEVRENGDDHGLIGIDRQIGEAPAGAVAGAEGYLFAFADTGLLEDDVEPFDRSRHLGIGEGLPANGIQRGLIPIFPGRIL